MTSFNEDQFDHWIDECLMEPAFEREAEPQEVERIASALQIALTVPKMNTLPDSLRAKLEKQGREFTAKERSRPKLRAVPPVREPAAGFEESRPSQQDLSPSGSSTWLPWTLAAASLLFAFWTLTARPDRAAPVVAKSALEQRDELIASSSVLQLDWTATEDPAAAGASGQVVWSDEEQKGFMTFRSLEVNDPTVTQYQLWIFDPNRPDEHPVDGGVFDVPAGASEVVVPIDPKLGVQNPKLFAITVEEPGGVVVSKRERIVLLAQQG